MNIVKLGAAALGLSVAAVPAQAAVRSIAVTAQGAIASTSWECVDEPCFTDHMPSVGMPWTLTVELSFTPHLQGTGEVFLANRLFFDIVGSVQMPVPQYFFSPEFEEIWVEAALFRNQLQYLSITQPGDVNGASVHLHNNSVHIFGWRDQYEHHNPGGQFWGEGRLTSLYIDGLPSPMITAPEPATWGLMIAGFGLVGAAARRRRRLAA